MTSQELLIQMKEQKFSLALIAEKTLVARHKHDRVHKGVTELKESDYKRLFTYARSIGFDV